MNCPLTLEYLATLKLQLGPPSSSILVVRPEVEVVALKMLREGAEALGALRLPQSEDLTPGKVFCLYGMEVYTKADQEADVWAFSDKMIAAAYLRGWLTEKALEELSKPPTATETTVLDRNWPLRLKDWIK